MKYILKNVLFGAETQIKEIGFKLISPEYVENETNELGEVISSKIIEAVYSDEKQYDTDLELPVINEGDEAYYVTATLFISEENNIIPDFKQVVKIVSLNSMNGFEVDDQREKFLVDYIANLNKM